MFEFKVYRNGKYIGNVKVEKTDGKWQPLETSIIVKGDILESVSDGVKLEVTYHNPKPYIRAGLEMRIVE